MNKDDLINIVKDKSGSTKKEIKNIIDLFLDEVINSLVDGDKVVLSNFGTFEKSVTKSIDIYSPYDGKLLKDVPQIRIRFKSSSNLKNKLKK